MEFQEWIYDFNQENEGADRPLVFTAGNMSARRKVWNLGPRRSNSCHGILEFC